MFVRDILAFLGHWVFYYFTAIALIFLSYKYFKLNRLKRKFKEGDEWLKKYMKMDTIPTKEDVDNKFTLRRFHRNKRLYNLFIRIVIVNIGFFLVNFFLTPYTWWFYIFTVFAASLLLYKYILVFHIRKWTLNRKWEEKKIKKYLIEY